MNCLNRVSTAIVLGITSALVAATASAIDLRDWGRKLPPSERFGVLAQFTNDAVLDKETQLVWQRAPGDDHVSFDAAWDSCDRATIGGRMGWRLPTLPELRSLIDPSITNQYVPALPAGHPFTGVMPPFGNADGYYGKYWTSTLTTTQDTTYRLTGFMSRNIVPTAQNIAAQLPSAWCVRGPGQ